MIINDLADLVLMLPLPEDYYKGQRTSRLYLPDNILCWHPHELLTSAPGGYGYHQHYRFVLMLSVRGSVTVVVDEHMFRLTPGHAILCFPFQQHTFLDADDDRAWLFITFELGDADNLAPLKNRLLRPDKGAWTLASQVAATYLTNHRSNSTSLLTGLLLEELLQSAPRAARGVKNETDLGLLEKVNQSIWSSMDRPIDIQSLADEHAISASHLRLLFRKKFNQSLGRYIRETKINRARDYLATTGMTISEVADACGFTSLYAFSRAFKSVSGLSPRQYREQAKTRK